MDALPAPLAPDDDSPHDNLPPDAPQPGRTRRSQSRSGDNRRPDLPSRDGILRMLASLPRFVLIGVVSPAAANSITRALQTLLSATSPGSSASATQSSGAFNAALWRDILLQFPEVGEDLGAFFTDAQVDELFGEPREEG